MNDERTPSDELPDDFFDRFFESGDEPDGWSALWIVLVPEDASVDPSGKALEPTEADANALAHSVAEEQCRDGEIDSDRTIDPDAIEMDAAEIQEEANRVLPELEDELKSANAQARATRDKAMEECQKLGANVRDAISAVADAARADARAHFLSFHSWSMQQYRCCLRLRKVGNQWAQEHPLDLAMIAIVVSVIITAAAS